MTASRPNASPAGLGAPPAGEAPRAKIVCTLGPATESPATIAALVEAGMDVARLNFSHGTHAGHAAMLHAVREAARASGRAVAVLADLQGPKIRLGTFAGGSAALEAGAPFTLWTAPRPGDVSGVSTSWPDLAHDLRPGDTLLVDDGRIRLTVEQVAAEAIRCRVIEGGVVSDHKGLNLPGVRISAPALTAKDEDDLRFALQLDVDLIALSFVRSPEHAAAVRQVMEPLGVTRPVIAKLEKPEAVHDLERIVEAFDGIMVARGDLGVELPLEQVPLVQKQALRLARVHAKPAIVATQMLESMVEQPRPTRAEVSDVANAVLDGADALMLSAETSVGRHAVAAVATMRRVITAAETMHLEIPAHPSPSADATRALASAAARVASETAAIALVAFTRSGATARALAAERPDAPLLAFTTEESVRRQLAVSWGIESFTMPAVDHTDQMVAQVDAAMRTLHRGRAGDRVVMLAGTPPNVAGSTNMLRVHQLGGA